MIIEFSSSKESHFSFLFYFLFRERVIPNGSSISSRVFIVRDYLSSHDKNLLSFYSLFFQCRFFPKELRKAQDKEKLILKLLHAAASNCTRNCIKDTRSKARNNKIKKEATKQKQSFRFTIDCFLSRVGHETTKRRKKSREITAKWYYLVSFFTVDLLLPAGLAHRKPGSFRAVLRPALRVQMVTLVCPHASELMAPKCLPLAGVSLG